MPEFVNFEFSLRRPEEVNHSIQNIQRVQKNQKLCQIFEVFQTTGAGSKRTVLETFSEEQLTSVPKLAARADCVQPPKSPKRIKNPKKTRPQTAVDGSKRQPLALALGAKIPKHRMSSRYASGNKNPPSVPTRPHKPWQGQEMAKTHP